MDIKMAVTLPFVHLLQDYLLWQTSRPLVIHCRQDLGIKKKGKIILCVPSSIRGHNTEFF